MTEGEKMVWAAAYAASYMLQQEKRVQYGIPVRISEAIENASSAVIEMREDKAKFEKDWGECEELNMLDEILR